MTKLTNFLIKLRSFYNCYHTLRSTSFYNQIDALKIAYNVSTSDYFSTNKKGSLSELHLFDKMASHEYYCRSCRCLHTVEHIDLLYDTRNCDAILLDDGE